MELLVVEMLKFGFRFAAMKIWHRVTLIQNHKNYHFELEVSFTPNLRLSRFYKVTLESKL